MRREPARPRIPIEPTTSPPPPRPPKSRASSAGSSRGSRAARRRPACRRHRPSRSPGKRRRNSRHAPSSCLPASRCRPTSTRSPWRKRRRARRPRCRGLPTSWKNWYRTSASARASRSNASARSSRAWWRASCAIRRRDVGGTPARRGHLHLRPRAAGVGVPHRVRPPPRISQGAARAARADRPAAGHRQDQPAEEPAREAGPPHHRRVRGGEAARRAQPRDPVARRPTSIPRCSKASRSTTSA